MKVELLNIFGDDNMIVDVARVSYNKLSKDYSKEQNDKLIKYLWNNNHISPFKHPKIQFRLEVPIYVERHLTKHQVGVEVNQISGRYVDFSDTYTTIDVWRKQSKSSKQGSEGTIDKQNEAHRIELNIIDVCKDAYRQLLDIGVSKEQARTILPLNLNTTIIWTGSLLAFMHMCNLRLKKDTQQETREVVKVMYDEVVKTSKFTTTFKVIDKKGWII